MWWRCLHSQVWRMCHRSACRFLLVSIFSLWCVINHTAISLNFQPKYGVETKNKFLAVESLRATGALAEPLMLEIRDDGKGELFQKGLQLYRDGDVRGAIALWQQAIKIYQQQDSQLNLAKVAENLGNAYLNLQEYNQTLEFWEIALQAYNLLQDSQSQTRLWLAKSRVYLQIGESKRGIDMGYRALEMSQKHQLKSAQVSARCLLGEIYWLRGNSQEAIMQLKAGAKLARRQNDIVAENQIFTILGNVYTTSALANYRRAQTLEQLEDRNLARTKIQKAAKQNRNAIAAFRHALTLAKQARNPIAQVRAIFHLTPAVSRNQQQDIVKNQLDQAESLIMTLPDSLDKANLLRELAVLLLAPTNTSIFVSQCQEIQTSQEQNRAIELLQLSADLAKQISDRRAQSLALGYMGHIQECRQNYPAALTYTQTAQTLAQADTVNNLRKEKFNVSQLDSLYLWYWQLGRIYTAQNQTQPAFDAYSASINHLQSLTHSILFSNRDIYANFRDGIEPVYVQLARLYLQQSIREPTQAQIALTQAVKIIGELQGLKVRNYLATNANGSFDGNHSLNMQANSQTAIIYSLVCDDATALIAQFPNGEKQLQWIDVPKEVLYQNVNSFRRELENRGQPNYDTQQSQQLYNWIIQPFDQNLEKFSIDTIVFLHNGIFRTVPMSALHDGSNFLIQKYAVLNTSGISPSIRQSHQQPNRALALGITKDVVVDGRTLHPLPYIVDEIQHILRQIPGSKKLIDEEFTRNRLRQELETNFYGILHIATHGEFNAIADRTFLVTGDKENNKLSISDLENLLRQTTKTHQNVELIALTACGTAIGDERATLGFAGIAIQAGANNALASLWSIGDSATTQVISRFYTYWLQEGLTKAVALQKSQQEMIFAGGAYAHPFYWAPYILVGDGE